MQKILIVIAAVAILLIGFVWFTDDMSRDDGGGNDGPAEVVGVVMNGSRNDGGWNVAHFRAFESAKERLGVEILYYDDTVPVDARSIPRIREIIGDGASIVFTTSNEFGDAVLAVCDNYRNVKFYHCTGTKTRPNVSVYAGRMYQMRYLSGIAAGLQTKSDRVGYVAALPINDVIRDLDAFTLGVRSVNVGAKVYVEWTNAWFDFEREYAAAESLIGNRGVDVIAYHQDSDAVIQAAEKHGIWAIGYNSDKSLDYPDTILTSVMWNWEPFYVSFIQAARDGAFKRDLFWLGAEVGAVRIAPMHARAKPWITDMVNMELQRLAEGTWDVFHGPIYDVNGALRVDGGSSISDRQLLESMDWFVDGVVVDDPAESGGEFP